MKQNYVFNTSCAQRSVDEIRSPLLSERAEAHAGGAIIGSEDATSMANGEGALSIRVQAREVVEGLDSIPMHGHATQGLTAWAVGESMIQDSGCCINRVPVRHQASLDGHTVQHGRRHGVQAWEGPLQCCHIHQVVTLHSDHSQARIRREVENDYDHINEKTRMIRWRVTLTVWDLILSIPYQELFQTGPSSPDDGVRAAADGRGAQMDISPLWKECRDELYEYGVLGFQSL